MADRDPDEQRQAPPSLELPKLGWRRKRRTPSSPADQPPDPPAERPTAGRAPAPAPERAPEPTPEPAAEAATETPIEPVSEPAAAVEPRPSEPAPSRLQPAPRGRDRRPDPEPPVATSRPTARPAGTSVDVAEPPAEPPADPTTGPAPSPAGRQRPRLRRPSGMVAVVLTGLVVGLGIVGLTWASLRMCETFKGTPSCGGTGYPLLAAIVVAMVVVGGLLLRAARVPEPGSTSFLAVGLTAVVGLLFVDSLLDRAMVVVIPVVSAATFAAAHWVTRTFVEPGDRPR